MHRLGSRSSLALFKKVFMYAYMNMYLPTLMPICVHSLIYTYLLNLKIKNSSYIAVSNFEVVYGTKNHLCKILSRLVHK